MQVDEAVLCYHCGQPCEDTPVVEGDKAFCCNGCKLVYDLINTSQLCQYYSFESHPGTKIESINEEAYSYLDESAIRRKLIGFDSEKLARIHFIIPAIHCVSCIWLLENLQKADPGILRSEVNFSGKSITIDFNPHTVKLSRLAALLAALGYAPRIEHDSGKEKKVSPQTAITLKLAVAGFVFGNIMLLSFPEYLGLNPDETILRRVFSWLSLALAIPVLLYSARDYFQAAWKSFSQRQINIDVPIAAGLVALFARSAWDIITGYGPGYLDSFSGLVFFLLIGRWFQGKTYEVLAFDRDYTSYFPLAVQHWNQNAWEPIVIHELKKDDRIKIRNQEIVPADSLLIDSEAYLDYSFVTGESQPIKVTTGGKVFAGGRLLGKPIELVVEKATSQSHLTSLWNQDAFRKQNESYYGKIIDRAARQFTWIVMAIAAITGVYWYFFNPAEMWLVLTSVLMVACPCALALAAPFTYGSMLRAFGQRQLYLKNADVIERMATIDTVVFDKTGTVTYGKDPAVTFEGKLLHEEWVVVKQLTGSSTHPLSSLIAKSIHEKEECEIKGFREVPGKGLEGFSGGHHYHIGSAEFTGAGVEPVPGQSRVFVSIDGAVAGFFVIRVKLRTKVDAMISRLGLKTIALLSGDGESDKERMKEVFPANALLYFNQSPQEKMDFIKLLQQDGRKVLMVGDGLNDAGALRQSDVGIAVTDDTGIFTPACDGILEGSRLAGLDKFLALARSSTFILKMAFTISFLYNAIALGIAVTGHLTPLVAAILMPISSISVVSFSTLAVNYTVNRKIRTE